jgi:hypothetical protein
MNLYIIIHFNTSVVYCNNIELDSFVLVLYR